MANGSRGCGLRRLGLRGACWPVPAVEWFTYGGDPASSKYSPADDITPQNVARLSIAWQWEHGEKPLEQYGTTPYRFENQPLMVDGVLYVTTPTTTPWRLTRRAARSGGVSTVEP